MNTMSYTLPEFKLSEPELALLDFCGRYPRPEAQQELWRWFILALKDNYDGLSSARTTNLIAFYENLKTLVSAVYQLHDLPGEAEALNRAPHAPLPGTASLAAALDMLRATVSHNWTLVVCPPEECRTGSPG